MQLTVGQRSSLVASLFNNSRWVTERVAFQTCCLEGFSEFRLDTVELTGDFWLHCRLQKCGEVGSAVFHAPPVWHKPVSPLQCLPGCIMFLWQTGWLGLRSSRQRWTDWKDRREEKEREMGGAGGVERGSPASLCQGFPRSHLGRVNPRLAQAHSWILTSPLSLSLHVPTAPPPPPPSPSRPRQWIKELVYASQQKKKASSAKRRGDTSWRRLPTTARSWFFSVQRVRKESRKVAIHLHRIMRSVDEKEFRLQSSSVSSGWVH